MSIPLFWHQSNNFGDALAPWFVRRLSGQDSIFVDHKLPGPIPYLVTGSIFSYNLRRGIVWGAGSAFEKHLDPSRLAPPSDQVRVIATRGPLSQKLVEAAGHRPQICGDPALLLDVLYSPTLKPRHRAGILCSWVDYPEVSRHYADDLPVLNASSPVETVLDTLASWDLIISSCLHGLVAGVAFNKPILWAQFSNRMVGDGFKFRDFFALFGETNPKPSAYPRNGTKAKRFTYNDHDALLASCPFLNASTL